ncbi:MAG: gamma carbonic anhydrase family protein [Candidatus Caldatribacteriota bacterium]
MIINYYDKKPLIDQEAFIAENATLIGEVIVKKNASIWYHTVLRGDIAPIIIGENTSIQDGTIIHCVEEIPTVVGNNVTVGHQVVLHACKIGDYSLIGMGAVVLDEAEIGEAAIVGAGALIAPRTKIPPHSLVMGVPAKIVRKLREDEILKMERHVQGYVELMKTYKSNPVK